MGCTTGPKIASGDNLRAPPYVGKNDDIAFLARYFLVCLVPRCWTSTNPAPIGVSQDCEEIPDGTSCRVAWAVGFESAYHTGVSGFAIGQLESNAVPSYMCEEKKCVSVATADSSLLASDRTRLTSGDQCNVVSTAGFTGNVSTLTCIFEVMNGSVSLMGGLPNCSATVCAVTSIPSGMSHDWDGIAFWESRCANCRTGRPPGFHRTTSGRKQAHLRSRPTKTPPKFHEKIPRERKKE